MGERSKKRVAPNLYVVTRANGAKQYVVRFMVEGKARERSIGNVNTLTLRQAKAKVGSMIESAGDSSEQPKQVPDFRECCQSALVDIERVKRWKNIRSSAQWKACLENDALPILGRLRTDQINREDVLKVLRPIWNTKPESARRLQQRLSAIFDWCIVKSYRADNPAQWRSNLQFFLPPITKVIQRQHHDAPSIEELRQVVSYCRQHPSPVSGLILFVLATVCRVSEARQATASQINADVWIVPGAAQKVDRGDRRVSLSALAIEALTMASPDGYLFPGWHGMISLDSARLKINGILKRKTTIHGVRSTFRDWCARSGIDRDTAERCLSHDVGTATEQAYLRDDFLEPRRAVLERWAKELSGSIVA